MVKSVLVELEAKDKNLSEENTRFWNSEIANHRYMFDRIERKIEEIKKITKSQWQQSFEDLFFAKRRRVDFRYNSFSHKEQEATTEFKFDGEIRHASLSVFKKSMGLYADTIKARYANAEFKL